jgi:hypothetical protein
VAQYVSQYAGKILLDAVWRNVFFTPPTQLYVAIYSVAPTEAGGGTEFTGGGYARQPVTVGAAVNGTTGRVAQTSSSADLFFLNMPLASTSAVAVAAWDAATGGNLWWVNDSWTPPNAWTAGQNVRVPAASLTAFFTK